MRSKLFHLKRLRFTLTMKLFYYQTRRSPTEQIRRFKNGQHESVTLSEVFQARGRGLQYNTIVRKKKIKKRLLTNFPKIFQTKNN